MRSKNRGSKKQEKRGSGKNRKKVEKKGSQKNDKFSWKPRLWKRSTFQHGSKKRSSFKTSKKRSGGRFRAIFFKTMFFGRYKIMQTFMIKKPIGCRPPLADPQNRPPQKTASDVFFRPPCFFPPCFLDPLFFWTHDFHSIGFIWSIPSAAWDGLW